MTETKFLTTYEGVVSQTVVKLREERGISQAAFAEQVGLSPSTWSRIESGDSGLSLDQLKKAAEILSFQPHQLLEIADRVIEESPQLEVVGKKKEMLAAMSVAAGAAAMVPISGVLLGSIVGVLAASFAGGLSTGVKKK